MYITVLHLATEENKRNGMMMACMHRNMQPPEDNVRILVVVWISVQGKHQMMKCSKARINKCR